MFDSAVTNWAIFGLILSILELFVPGVYLIWFGFAAFVVSLLVNLFGIAFTAQMIWFAILSVIFAVLGLYTYKYLLKKTQTPKEYSNLNNSAEQFVGNLVTVSEDIEDNMTKVKIGDTYWLATSTKPLKKGDQVKVVGVKDNLILIVE
jgi:membrane protein implicated in regulation of membrane protease activity